MKHPVGLAPWLFGLVLVSCAGIEGDDPGECSDDDDVADDDDDVADDDDDVADDDDDVADDDDDVADDDDDVADDDDDVADDDAADDDSATGDDDDTQSPIDADGDGWDETVDCDDGNANIHPGHAEVCNDGLDNDCDGTANACGLAGTIGVSSSDVYIVGDDNHGQAGVSVAGAGDLDGDGYGDLIVGAYQVDVGLFVDGGAAYILQGPLSGGVDLGVSAVRLAAETTGDWAGYWVSGGGDVDGDGRSDVLVGAPERSDVYPSAGAAYLVYGPIPADMNLYSADAKFMGEGEGDWAGAALDIRGDADADGVSDILVASPLESSAGEGAGAVYLLYGPQYGDLSLGAADAKLAGLAAGDRTGSSVAFAGDMDGDGADEILIGAAGADHPGEDAGAVYLFHGPVHGEVNVSSADAVFTGESAYDHAGSSVATAGDVDGDGFADILVGAYGEASGGPSAGAAYLLVGPQGGSVSLGWATAKLIGENAGDLVGVSLDTAGDVNGDGLDDLLLGASGEDTVGTDGGAAYLLYSPVSGAFDLSLADAKLTSWAAFDGTGHTVSWCGDLNADGYDDLFLGAPLADIGGLDAGAAYVLHGEGL